MSQEPWPTSSKSSCHVHLPSQSSLSTVTWDRGTSEGKTFLRDKWNKYSYGRTWEDVGEESLGKEEILALPFGVP